MPSGVKGRKTFNCMQCSKECFHSYQGKNKFCSREHFQEWQWSNVSKVKIEQGINTSASAILRYLSERDGYKCSGCQIGEWLGEKIILDVDHIDGNRKNNLPLNLRLLCPNCHRMTPTWGNKKRI